MAIIPSSEYPGQITGPSTDYPLGSAVNESDPGLFDGTPWEARGINDVYGLLQALLSAGGVTPSGDPDTATNSQYLTALRNTLQGQPTEVTDVALGGGFAPTARVRLLRYGRFVHARLYDSSDDTAAVPTNGVYGGSVTSDRVIPEEWRSPGARVGGHIYEVFQGVAYQVYATRFGAIRVVFLGPDLTPFS